MTRHEFLHITIRDLQARINAYYKIRKEQHERELDNIEYHAWLTGLYVQRAVGSVVSSKCKYPDNPFNFATNAIEKQKNLEASGKSQAEIEQEQRYYEMLIRQANAKIANAMNENEG